MSWRSSVRFALIGLLASLLVSGCGSLSQLTGGRSRETRSGGGPDRSGVQLDGRKKAKKKKKKTKTVLQEVGAFTGFVNGRTGEFTLRADVTARTRATRFGPINALSFSGTAAPAPGGLLRGNVTLTSSNPTEFHDVKAIVSSISDTNVTVSNAAGTTSLTGTPRPYWDFGSLTSVQPSATRLWEFRNSGGVSFSFRIVVYANTFSYSSADGGDFVASSFTSATQGWAVGNDGKIMVTSDGGATWSPQNAGTDSSLKDVCFVNSDQGWAVGANGTVMATSNGGVTWRRQAETVIDTATGTPVTVTTTLNGVKFINATTGWAVGGNRTILRTTDGGNTWQQAASGGSTNLRDVCFVNATTGWIVGEKATILRTSDGGISWTSQTVPSSQLPSLPSFSNLHAVYFADSSNGWAVGVLGWILFTTDGGVTWTRRNLGTSFGTPNFNSVFFANSSAGWVVGTSGVGIKTTDGGATWTSMPIPTGANLWSVACLPGNPNNLWIAAGNGLTLYSTSGGSSWQRPGQAAGQQWAVTSSGLNALWFADSSRGWLVGDGGTMLRTTDGGVSWRSMLGAAGNAMQDVCFVSASEGWAVGLRGHIIHTTDGGQSWEVQGWSGLEQPTPPNLLGVRFLDSLNGWAVGSNTILKTNDGGMTWETIPPPVLGAFQKIAWLDADRGWIVGSKGVILATFDGGMNWDPVSSGTGNQLNQIEVTASGPTGLSAWAVGASGTLLHSTDGINWTPISLGLTGVLTGIDFLPNGQVGWITGDLGLVLRTLDGGATWDTLDSGTHSTLRTVRMLSADEVWVAGASGALKVFR